MARIAVVAIVLTRRGQIRLLTSGRLGSAITRVSIVVRPAAGPPILSLPVASTGRFDGRAGGGILVRGRAEAEDVDGVRGGGHAEEGGAEVEGHAVDGGGVGAPAELVQLLAPGHGEDADDGARLAGGGEERAVAVEGQTAQGRAVCLYHILRLERETVEDEELARCGRGELGLGRSVGGTSRGGAGAASSVTVLGFVAGFGERVDEEAVLGGRGEGADGVGVRGGVDGVEEAHVADVVDVDFLLEDDNESLAVEADGEDGGGEGEFADDGASLLVLCQ